MKATPTAIPDVIRLDPQTFADDRGLFFESFSQKHFEDVTGQSVSFVQDNHSSSRKGVVRGLHYQIPPRTQGKLVRVVQGEIFDVAVDLRKDSPHFGTWVGEILSAANRRQVWIPQGFAHGFQVLSDNAEVIYKVTDYWSATHERSLKWDDVAIGIAWPFPHAPLLSDKDRLAPPLSKADLF